MSPRWGLGVWGFGTAINMSPRWGYVGSFVHWICVKHARREKRERCVHWFIKGVEEGRLEVGLSWRGGGEWA